MPKKSLCVQQQCYHCGRNLTRILDQEELQVFKEDHPEFPLGFGVEEVGDLVVVRLPEMQCDPCTEQWLDYKYGPECQ